MKSFAEMNSLVVGTIGCAITGALVLGSLQYDKLPFLSSSDSHSAYFAELGGLETGSVVQVSGKDVGKVTDIELAGQQVLVEFTTDKDIRLGERTEAAIKTETVLGAKNLAIDPRGAGELEGVIPVERTKSPYELSEALGDLTTTISGLDTGQLSDALTSLSQTFQDTPPDLALAIDGVARFADTINTRDEQLRNLLTNANDLTSVLAERSDQIASLIVDANALLIEFQNRSVAIDQVMSNVSAASRQLSGIVADNREHMKPALDKLNSVLDILDNRKGDIQESIKKLNQYAMSLGESVGSGPFYKAYLANLLPGQFLQPFVDAAFADQGIPLDQSLPSELVAPSPAGAPAPGAPPPDHPAPPAPPGLPPIPGLPLPPIPGLENVLPGGGK